MRKKTSTTIQDIDTPHYSYLQAIYLSFYSKKLYVDVAKRWKNLSLLYLFLIFVLVCIPLSIRLIATFNEFFEQKLIYPFQKLPICLIQNGQLNFDKPMPYLVKNDLGKIVAIVDTTGTVNTIDNRYPDLVVLINKDKLSYRSPALPSFFFETSYNEPRNEYVQPFGKETNQIFDGGKWVSSSNIRIMKYVTEAIIYPSLVGIIFTLYSIIMFAVAMLVQFFSKVLFKVDISYLQGFRLLMVSGTPHLVFLSIYLMLNQSLTSMKIFLLIVWVAYLSFSLIALKKSSHKLVRR